MTTASLSIGPGNVLNDPDLSIAVVYKRNNNKLDLHENTIPLVFILLVKQYMQILFQTSQNPVFFSIFSSILLYL